MELSDTKRNYGLFTQTTSLSYVRIVYVINTSRFYFPVAQ